jgi:hypothetical protein
MQTETEETQPARTTQFMSLAATSSAEYEAAETTIAEMVDSGAFILYQRDITMVTYTRLDGELVSTETRTIEVLFEIES